MDRQRRQEPPHFSLQFRERGSSRGRPPRGRGSRGGLGRGARPFIPSLPKHLTQNNNDPRCSDRNPTSYPNMTYMNRKHYGYYPPRASRPSSRPVYPDSPKPSQHYPNTSNPSSPQVPAMPYITGMRPHYGVLPLSPHFSSPRRGGAVCRGKYVSQLWLRNVYREKCMLWDSLLKPILLEETWCCILICSTVNTVFAGYIDHIGTSDS